MQFGAWRGICLPQSFEDGTALLGVHVVPLTRRSARRSTRGFLGVELALPLLRLPLEAQHVRVVALAVELRLDALRAPARGASRCNRRGRGRGTARTRCSGRRAPCAGISRRRRSRLPDRAADTARSRCSVIHRSMRRAAALRRRSQGSRAGTVSTQQGRERVNRRAAARRALIDLRFTAGDGGRIGTASRIAAAGALCLRQQRVDACNVAG